MTLSDLSLRHPYGVTAVALALAVLGVFAMFRTATDLFPESAPPQVLVITMRPGAAASDVASQITELIERELSGISGIKKVMSTSRDEASSVSAEFLYTKPVGEAVLDVQNAIARIRAGLPRDILEPRIYAVTEATRPLLTLALSPAEGSRKTLSEIRLLAENDIADAFRALPGISDVEVMGAHQPEVNVRARRDRLAAHELTLADLVRAIEEQNVSIPGGMLNTPRGETLVNTAGEFRDVDALRALPVRIGEQGVVRLADVAEVTLGVQEPRSLYHGHGRPAIAVNILRPDRGPTVSAIREIKHALPGLRERYPDISLVITDDQQPLIDANVNGMRSSLAQAVVLTVAIIYLFLGDRRAAVVVSATIPLAFLSTLALLWLSPYTLNMVTLSGLIISVGMVVDAAVVVVENIYRHHGEQPGHSPETIARRGADEVSLAITAGMLTTVIVLVPVLFTGGYTQQVMRPLNLMIIATLVASLLASLSLIPLMASRLLAHPGRQGERSGGFRFMKRGIDSVAGAFTRLLRHALHRRRLTLALSVAFLAVSIRLVVPLIGSELMPPMDTGIATIEFDAPSSARIDEVGATLRAIEDVVRREPGVLMMSSVVGSEPGQISFGGGGAVLQSGRTTVHLVPRSQRGDAIWTIMDRWRDALRVLPGIQGLRINEFGATPMATTRAPLDIVISGPNTGVLSELADRALDALDGTPGLLDVRRSWYGDKETRAIEVDQEISRRHGLSPRDVALHVQAALKGAPAGSLRLDGFFDVPIRVQYAGADLGSLDDLEQVHLPTREGMVPLRALAATTSRLEAPFVAREHQRNVINITGVNCGRTIGQVSTDVKARLAGLALPDGYRLDVAGSAADMNENKARMGKSLALGLVLLYMVLLALFKSYRLPLVIMAAIPLSAAGALWGLLWFDKPLCMPAIMGFILLGGTVVNNSILLVEFAESARVGGGASVEDAMMQAVRLRVRPILMTTVSTIVGLTPLVFEMAVGLERMSPLGIAAAVGLAFGTLLTMVVIPVLYVMLEDGGRPGRALRK